MHPWRFGGRANAATSWISETRKPASTSGLHCPSWFTAHLNLCVLVCLFVKGFFFLLLFNPNKVIFFLWLSHNCFFQGRDRWKDYFLSARLVAGWHTIPYLVKTQVNGVGLYPALSVTSFLKPFQRAKWDSGLQHLLLQQRGWIWTSFTESYKHDSQLLLA